jgi:transketolase
MTAPATDTAWVEGTEAVAAGIRRRVLKHVLDKGEGYMSQACSSAEWLAMLYTRVLRLAPVEAPLVAGEFPGVPGRDNPEYHTGAAVHGSPGPDYDRLIFSPAHYALSLYSVLIEVGRLDPAALDDYNRDGSTVEMIGAEHSPGFEVTSGSLAQALSQAAGIALGRKLKGERGKVWVVLSDGELEEGQTWEAVATASFLGLDNLRVVVDANGQQCDGLIDSVSSLEPMRERFISFGASCDEVDGHDLLALDEAMQRPSDRPHVVIARTDPVRGVPLLAERAPKIHTLRLGSDETERARYQAAYEAMLP